MRRVRPKHPRLAATAVAAMLVASCGILELGGASHEAVTLDQARTEGSSWEVTVELLATEIAGTTVVALQAPPTEVACADGTALPDHELPLGRELVFVQDGDVHAGEPPQVQGLEVMVDCG